MYKKKDIVQMDKLLEQLEDEGLVLRTCRKKLNFLTHSGQKLDRTEVLSLVRKYNKHIENFNRLDRQLVQLEEKF